MRSTRYSFVAVLLLAGCGSGGGTKIKLDAGVDMSGQMAKPDMTMQGCQAPMTDCNGTCVNTQTDIKNCGVCGMACAMGDTCEAGVCTPPMGNMTGCAGFVQCANQCPDQPCVMDCFANTTTKGKMLVQAVFGCLDAACPSGAGQVCDPNGDPMACDACYAKAQMQGGACINEITACNMDMP